MFPETDASRRDCRLLRLLLRHYYTVHYHRLQYYVNQYYSSRSIGMKITLFVIGVSAIYSNGKTAFLWSLKQRT